MEQHDDFSGRGLSRRTLLSIGAAVIVGACAAESAKDEPESTSSSASTTDGAPTTDGVPTTDASTSTTTVTAATDSTTATTETAAASCDLVPGETAGPFPGDGSNGPNALADPAVVRRNMANSFGDASGSAAGIPTVVRFRLTDLAEGCAAYPNAAIYAWHCDQEGRYSMYDLPDQNYLRAVQSADGNGVVEFDTVFPGCYPGRWPHIHFEVYATVDEALAGEGLLATSQIAIPQAACDLAYAADGYANSVSALSRLSLERDNVFGDDGAVRQIGTSTGDAARGFDIELAVSVDSTQRTVPGAGGR
jgi:protocatechuate 3,4-dioxygenase beta subunit